MAEQSGWLRRLKSFVRDHGGSVLVEAAFVLPMLTTLLMGGLEAGRYILLEQKLSRIAANAGDLVARLEDVTAADVNQVFASIEYTARPFSIDDQGLVIISFLNNPSGPDPVTMEWQFTGAGTPSKVSAIGVPGGGVTLPTGFTLTEGATVVVAETFYEYEPFFIFEAFIEPRDIYHSAFYRPRFAPPVAAPTP